MKGIPPVVWVIGATIYVICPLDLDFIPVIGWIDDVIVAYLGIAKWRHGVRAKTEAKAHDNAQRSQPSIQEVELLPPLLLSEVRSPSKSEGNGR